MSVTAFAETGPPLSAAKIGRTWRPHVASWIFMTSELVIATAVIATLAALEVNLAASGPVLVIQAPAQVLLPSSTALSTNAISHARLRRYALTVPAGLTTLHVLFSMTPLYHVLMGAISTPDEVTAAVTGPPS